MLEILFWDCFVRFPQQKSNEIFLSKCHLYRMEMLMKHAAGRDSASVGIRLPNGSYERPIGNNRLFWVLPGKCTSCKSKKTNKQHQNQTKQQKRKGDTKRSRENALWGHDHKKWHKIHFSFHNCNLTT